MRSQTSSPSFNNDDGVCGCARRRLLSFRNNEGVCGFVLSVDVGRLGTPADVLALLNTTDTTRPASLTLPYRRSSTVHIPPSLLDKPYLRSLLEPSVCTGPIPSPSKHRPPSQSSPRQHVDECLRARLQTSTRSSTRQTTSTLPYRQFYSPLSPRATDRPRYSFSIPTKNCPLGADEHSCSGKKCCKRRNYKTI